MEKPPIEKTTFFMIIFYFFLKKTMNLRQLEQDERLALDIQKYYF